MKIAKSLIVVLTLVATSLTYANVAKLTDDVRKELEAVYAKIDAAIEEKDVKTLESLLGEDYEKQVDGKTLKRDEAVAQMKKVLKQSKKSSRSKRQLTKSSKSKAIKLLITRKLPK